MLFLSITPALCFRDSYRSTSGCAECGYLFQPVSAPLPTTSIDFFEIKRTSDNLDLGNTVGVTENDTNLRGSSTLTGELADLLNDLLGGNLQPGGSGARVREGAGRHALTLAVKSTHFDEVVL